MELNEDLKFLLELKFATVEEMVRAFKKAIGAPELGNGNGVKQEVLMRAVTLWAQEGAPSKFEITPKNVDLILEVKYGSLQSAYTHWTMMTEPGKQTNLTDLEYQRIIDYIPNN